MTAEKAEMAGETWSRGVEKGVFSEKYTRKRKVRRNENLEEDAARKKIRERSLGPEGEREHEPLQAARVTPRAPLPCRGFAVCEFPRQ